MSDKKLGIIAAVLLVVAGYYFFRPKGNEKSEPPKEVEEEVDERRAAPPPPVAPTTPGASVTGRPPVLETPTTALEDKPEVSEDVKKQFANHMVLMARCLGTKAASPENPPEPTIEGLMDQLRPALGNSVMQMHDWSQTEILDHDGVRRRVRVDYDYVEGEEPKRRLSMYQMNAYNMPEIVELTPDQADNPNAGYISSLVEGKKIIGDESANRVYFGNGEELLFSTRDGYLNNISVSKGDRTFNCHNLDDGRSACTCP